MKYSALKIKRVLRVFSLGIFFILGLSLTIFVLACLILRLPNIETYFKVKVEEIANLALEPYSAKISMENLELNLPFSVVIEGVDIDDTEGNFAHIEEIQLSSQFFSLLRYRVVIPKTGLQNAEIYRLPKLTSPPEVVDTSLSGNRFYMPKLEVLLADISELLFHSGLPSIRFHDIYATDMRIAPKVLDELRAQSQGDENLQNSESEKREKATVAETEQENTTQENITDTPQISPTENTINKQTDNIKKEQAQKELIKEAVKTDTQTNAETSTVINTEAKEKISATISEEGGEAVAEKAVAEKAVAEKAGAEKAGAEKTGAENVEQDIFLSFKASASLDNGLLRFKSELGVSYAKNSPMSFKSHIDIFDTHKLRTQIILDDNEGMLFNLANSLGMMPFAPNGHLNIHMENTGSFADFTLPYQINFYNSAYLQEEAKITGHFDFNPLMLEIEGLLAPKVQNLLEHGTIALNASFSLFSQDASENKEPSSDISDNENNRNIENNGNIATVENNTKTTDKTEITEKTDNLESSTVAETIAKPVAENSETVNNSDSEVTVAETPNTSEVVSPDTLTKDTHNTTEDILQIIRVKYAIKTQDMAFLSPDLKHLLGETQDSQGQLDLVFSKTEFPYAKSDTISFNAKNIQANIDLYASYDLDIKAKVLVKDLSFLNTPEQIIEGQTEAFVAVTGDAERLLYEAQLKIPELIVDSPLIAKVKTKQEEAIEALMNNQSEYVNLFEETEEEKPQRLELKNLIFSIKSEDLQTPPPSTSQAKLTEEEEANIAKQQQLEEAIKDEQSHATGKENLYGLQVNKLLQTFLNNTRTPKPLVVNFHALYNKAPVDFSSVILVTPELLGKNTGNPRSLLMRNIKLSAFAFNLQGNLAASFIPSGSYAQDLSRPPLLFGGLTGKMQNADQLQSALHLPMEIDSLDFLWKFTVNNEIANARNRANNANSQENEKTQNNEINNEENNYVSGQNLYWKLSAQELGFSEQKIGQPFIDLNIQDLWGVPSLNGHIKAKTIEAGPVKSHDLNIQAQGPLTKLDLDANMKGNTVFNFKGFVGFDHRQQDIFLDIESFRLRQPESKTDIALKHKGQLRLSETLFSANNIRFTVAPKGEIDINGVIQEDLITLKGWFKDIDLSYLPVGVGGLLYGRFGFEGNSKRPSGYTDIRISDIKSPGMPLTTIDINGKIVAGNVLHELFLATSIFNKEALGIKEAVLEVHVPLQSEPRLRIIKSAPIQGTLKYDGRIEKIWKYIPLEGSSLVGNVIMDGKVFGTLQKPLVQVKAHVQDGKFEDILLGVLLKNIDALFQLEPYGQGTLQISAEDQEQGTFQLGGNVFFPRLSYGSYEPSLSLINGTQTSTQALRQAPTQTTEQASAEEASEQASTQNSAQNSAALLATQSQIETLRNAVLVLDLRGNLQAFAPLQRNDFNTTVSGDLYMRGRAAELYIGGNIFLDEGYVNLQNIQMASIPSLTIVENSNKRPKLNRQSIGQLDLKLSIEDNFFVYGPGIETEWSGNLHITGKTTDPLISGEISALNGNMDFLDRHFKLLTGKVYFDNSNPPAPILDVQLGYDAQSVAAKIELGGTPQRPKLNLSSTPSLPQDEILSHILFSSSVSELSAYEKIQLATTITSLAGFNFEGGIKKFGKKFFGLDVIRLNAGSSFSEDVDDGEDDDLSVEIGKYVRDNIYVGIEQGINEKGTSAITKFQINKNISAGVKAGTDDAEVNLEWKFDY